jgi:16S rRNA processing protein RimM
MVTGTGTRKTTRTSTDDTPHGFVAVARVLAPSGLRGEIKTEPLAPDAALQKGVRVSLDGTRIRIVGSQRRGRFLYLRLAGIETREWADALRGKLLLLPENELPALPDGQYYRFQLVGLAVSADDGRALGTLEEVLANPGGDVYVIRGPLGEVLVPAHEDFVLDVDLERGLMLIEAVPGLIPDAP